jgi:Ser/Thr protein kinase RdoA (MazF antagonist)
MDNETRQLLLTDAVPRLARLFRLPADALDQIQVDRNLVFKGFDASGKAVILKAMPSETGDREYVLGELDWMAFLHAKGLLVPRPNTSINGELVETLSIGNITLSACCLDRVDGTLWADCRPEQVDISLIGSLAGRMASVSEHYRPSLPEARRPSWRDAPWFRDPHQAIHASMPQVIDRVISLRNELDSLPHESFGIIHDDLHSWNIIIAADGKPIPIDFESSNYTWQIAEIASALYFHLWKTRDSSSQELTRKARKFVALFLEGYRREHTLSPFWIGLIPTFLKVRELSIFASCGLQDRDFESVGSNDEGFVFMKRNIEEGVPYVDLDFSEFGGT